MTYQAEEHRKEEGKNESFGIEKVLGVATLGAFASVAFYCLYQSVGEETKQAIREGLISGIKASFRKE